MEIEEITHHCSGLAWLWPPLQVLFHPATCPAELTKQPAGTPE